VLGRKHTAAKAPFGRGRIAARVLATVIDLAAAVGGRTPVGVAHRVAVLGGNLEWALRPRLRRRLAENLARAVDRAPESKAVRRLVREELVNEAKRSADLLWAMGYGTAVTRRSLGLARAHNHPPRPQRFLSDLLIGDLKAVLRGELSNLSLVAERQP